MDAPLLYEVGQGASHDPGQDVHGHGGDEAAADAQPAQVVWPGYFEIPRTDIRPGYDEGKNIAGILSRSVHHSVIILSLLIFETGVGTEK